jgi:hypothetical protein
MTVHDQNPAIRAMKSLPYICNGTEHLTPAEGIPQPLLGAPELTIIHTPDQTIVAYYLDDGDRNPVAEAESIGDTGHLHQFARVRLRLYASHLAPRGERDEHPLTQGLGEVVAEVRPSPWIRSASPPSGWSKFNRGETHWRHLLFALHDECFEAICQVLDVTIHDGPLEQGRLLAT